MSHVRLPRFRRAAQVPPIRITPRDREVLGHVARHRFLRSSHILDLVAGSRQQVLRRLQRLYHHGLLDRPRAQIDYYHDGGSRPIVYGLGHQGLAFLNSEIPFPRPPAAESDTDASPKRLFLDHSLLTSDVMVALELACRRNSRVRLLSGVDLLGPEALLRRDPFRWSVTLKGSTRLTVVPDRVFGVEWQDSASRPERAHFFLEADRGTMPVQRPRLRQSSFYRKLLAYQATWSQGLHQSRFGFRRFRVLTVTTNRARVQHLLEACRELERGQGLFLFTDLASFLAAPDLFALRWETASGQAGQLL